MSQKDLPANERDHLLRSLDLPNSELPFNAPGIHFTLDGQTIWDYPGFGRIVQSTLPSEF